jgi:hypothetical protein
LIEFVVFFYVSRDRQLSHQILRIVSFLLIVYESQGLPRIHQRYTTLACGFPQFLYEALIFFMIWAWVYFSSSQTQVIFCMSILAWKYKAELLIGKVVSLSFLNSRIVAIVLNSVSIEIFDIFVDYLKNMQQCGNSRWYSLSFLTEMTGHFREKITP